ncbi:MAG: hypothetical protein ACI9FD_002454, partial [Gammaproteobacteria bacterium]
RNHFNVINDISQPTHPLFAEICHYMFINQE